MLDDMTGGPGPGRPTLVERVRPTERLHWWRQPETLVCGVRGHVIPVAGVREVAPDLAHLEATTIDGRRLGRCLRCDAWIEAPLGATSGGQLRELRQHDVPRRGKALREAIILRAIAIERGVHAVVFGLAAVGLTALRLDLPGLQSQARQLTGGARGTLAGPGQTASREVLLRQLEHLVRLRSATLGVLAISAAVYCALEGTEAVGLWRERRWAEYLTAIATAGFLPFEIKELASRVTAFKVSALVLNVVVLAYLVWRKHLFGVGHERPDEDRVAALRAPGTSLAMSDIHHQPAQASGLGGPNASGPGASDPGASEQT